MRYGMDVGAKPMEPHRAIGRHPGMSLDRVRNLWSGMASWGLRRPERLRWENYAASWIAFPCHGQQHRSSRPLPALTAQEPACPCPCSLSCWQLGVQVLGERPEQKPRCFTQAWPGQAGPAAGAGPPAPLYQALCAEVHCRPCEHSDPPCDRPPAAPGRGPWNAWPLPAADDRCLAHIPSGGGGITKPDAHPRWAPFSGCLS